MPIIINFGRKMRRKWPIMWFFVKKLPVFSVRETQNIRKWEKILNYHFPMLFGVEQIQKNYYDTILWFFLTTFLNHGFSISLYIPIQTRKWHFQDSWQNDKKSRMKKIQNLRCLIPKTRYIGHVKNPYQKKSIEPAYSPPSWYRPK